MKSLRRRTLLTGLFSLFGAGALAYGNRNELIRWAITTSNNDQLVISKNSPNSTNSCKLSPEQTEGPFYVRSPIRSDLKEDRQGLPLELTIRLQSLNGCTPLKGAMVEIWHCDAAGRYSAYPENIARQPWETLKLVGVSDPNKTHVQPKNEKTYLRGGQVSNDLGEVKFSTIFPGWYDPRVPHIHVAVTVGGVRQYTSQLYFSTEFANKIYRSHPDYAAHGLCPYEHSNDPVLAEYDDASGLLVNVTDVNGGKSVDATLVLA